MKNIKTFEEHNFFTKNEDYTEFNLVDLWNSLLFVDKNNDVDSERISKKYEQEIIKLLYNKHISYYCDEHKDEIRKGDVEEIEFGYIQTYMEYGDYGCDCMEVYIKFKTDLEEDSYSHPIDNKKIVKIWHTESEANKYNL